MCGTVYHYRAIASAGGIYTSYGSDMAFTTLPCSTSTVILPTVVTVGSASITQNTAVLNGYISSTGGATAGIYLGFEYSTSAWGTGVLNVSGIGAPSFSTALTGLYCGTAYTFKAAASNFAGLVYGSNMTFTTLPCTTTAVLPIVTTVSATSITTTTVVLNGSVTSTGGATGTMQVGVDYGPTTSYGTDINITTFPTYGLALPYNYYTGLGGDTAIGRLSCNTTYHYRMWAKNSAGTAYGSDMTFTTLPCLATGILPTVGTVAASSVAVTSIASPSTIPATVSPLSSLPPKSLTISKNLYYGQRTPEVLTLQQYLIANGYLTVAANGRFGPATQAAVKKLQADLGIRSNGASFGPMTRAALANIK